MDLFADMRQEAAGEKERVVMHSQELGVCC